MPMAGQKCSVFLKKNSFLLALWRLFRGRWLNSKLNSNVWLYSKVWVWHVYFPGGSPHLKKNTALIGPSVWASSLWYLSSPVFSVRWRFACALGATKDSQGPLAGPLKSLQGPLNGPSTPKTVPESPCRPCQHQLKLVATWLGGHLLHL